MIEIDTVSTTKTDSVRPRDSVSDAAVIVYRNLLPLAHSPGQIIGILAFPFAFVVLFGYVFGSAISIGDGANYREYLMPGLFVMSITFSMASAMVVVSMDRTLGVMDRFRSMPIARSAVLLGRTVADLFVGAMTLAVMAGVGLLVGWRVHNDMGSTAGAFALLLLLQFTMSWVGVYLGSVVQDPQTAARLGPLLMPVTMITNVFVPTDTMPTILRVIAEWNPVSAAVAMCRELFGNPGAPASEAAWPIANPVMATIGWCVLLLALFVPLSVRQFTRPD